MIMMQIIYKARIGLEWSQNKETKRKKYRYKKTHCLSLEEKEEYMVSRIVTYVTYPIHYE